MRDAGHRTPDAGHRTPDIGHRTAKKAKIIYPPPRGVDIIIDSDVQSKNKKQAISARERALCQLTVCFEFQNRSDRRKGHKSCALEMVFRRKVRSNS